MTPHDASTPLRSEIAAAMSLEPIRYSQVWEDHALLEEGLALAPDDDVLSIASGGDNAFALLLAGARSVTAIDMSASQTALVALKVAALRALEHPDLAAFLGARPATDRWRRYRQAVRPALEEGARGYWDAHEETLAAGALWCGRLGGYFRGFREQHLAEVADLDAIEALLDADDLGAQRAAWSAAFSDPRFAERFRWYYGEEMLASGGRDPAQFAHVAEADVGALFLARFQRVCTELPTRGNFYLEGFLTQAYRDLERGPLYLRPSAHAALRERLGDLRVVTDELERFVIRCGEGAFSKANLSDLFEYASEAHTARLLEVLARALRPGGRLAYWNLLVPRSRPASLAHRLSPRGEEAERLWRQDRSWFYGAFVLEEVLP